MRGQELLTLVIYDIEDEGINSPPYALDERAVIREVVMTMVNDTLDDISVYVISNDGTHYFTATLPVGSTYHVTPCNIPVEPHTKIWIQLQDLGAADGDAHDLTVILRFGAETSAQRTDSEI